MGKEPQLFPESLKCHVCLSLNELLWPTFVGGRRDLKMYAGLSWCFGPRLWDFGQLFFSVGGGEVLHENVYRAFLDVLDGPQRPGTIMMIMNNC